MGVKGRERVGSRCLLSIIEQATSLGKSWATVRMGVIGAEINTDNKSKRRIPLEYGIESWTVR